jgi:acetyl-CoA/propionyl-CoA carboxylase biotin carboxyl carrier protein
VVSDPAFTAEPFTVHTRWIETEFAAELPPQEAAAADDDSGQPTARERITVEVGGKRLEVVIPAGMGGGITGGPGGPGRAAGTGRAGTAAGAGRPAAGRGRRGRGAGGGGQGGGNAGEDALVSPMQGTIVKIVAANGQQVSAGDTVVVLEAMKMEQPLTAHKDGTVGELAVQVGQTVSAGAVICQLRD